jgi:hypothetical protein
VFTLVAKMLPVPGELAVGVVEEERVKLNCVADNEDTLKAPLY